MEYRNFFENLKFINIVNFFCEDRLFIVFKGAMKYQEKIFFTRQDVSTTKNAQGLT